ncbi:DHH family phosphoesterase [Bacillus sp. D386]|uniref:DHH family phosphoesterase n=1 Tax=Bacillus sp. D386 TaxID=2587155 RepID=UPI00112490F6|nr:DHH family phosphoesterase [Bacillus sp. D386]
MPSYLNRQAIRYPIYALLGVSLVIIGVLAYYNWIFAIVASLLFGILFFLILKIEYGIQKETEIYISTLSYRLKKVGEEALLEMPIGILLFNEDYVIEWTNPYMAKCLQEDTLVGKYISEVAEPLIPLVKREESEDIVAIYNRKFRVVHKPEERLLYFFDVTEQTEIEKMYEEERTVIGIIYLDNYDDVTQGMDDQRKSSLNSFVTSLLNNWAKEYGVFLKRISSDRFIAIFSESILNHLEKTKFSILDDVRETTAKQNVPLTLSIGVGSGVSALPELGSIAQSSLDLALGRGGDQVAIKLPNGKVKFYGGKTNPMEKRTRVRARVISHALRDLIVDSDKVIVMGHKFPDMDAIGSSLGILKIAEMNNREGYIILDRSELDSSVKRLLSQVKQKPELDSRFISPEIGVELITDKTLLVIVDTHKPSMVIEEKLVSRAEKIVVIDHHRRGEEFIDNSILVYMEPYASSTAELVTELIEYQPKRVKVGMLEATALLAGIIVDTKSFTFRTGSRTFDAASFLRGHGADTVLVQKLLKEDVDTYLKRAKLIEDVYFYHKGIAIAHGDLNEFADQVLIAQAADTLLAMDEVIASFVLSRKSETSIGISARSLGDINVQVIMERLGGGGHLTNAATQLDDISMEKAEQMLKDAIDELYEGGTNT